MPDEADVPVAELKDEPTTDIQELVRETKLPPVVKLFNLILIEGLRARASDIHIEATMSEVRVRYRGYIERQKRTAERAAAMEDVSLPEALWAGGLDGLSHEAREKLLRWRPTTLAQASRIAGVSPADVTLLLVHARRAASGGTRPPRLV